MPLACVWHEEPFHTGLICATEWCSGLADGKPWVSLPLGWNGFTLQTCVTFLVFAISTNVPLTLLATHIICTNCTLHQG